MAAFIDCYSRVVVVFFKWYDLKRIMPLLKVLSRKENIGKSLPVIKNG